MTEILYLKSVMQKELLRVLRNDHWSLIATGQSGDRCYQVDLADGGTGFLKVFFGNKRTDTAHEVDVISWLRGKSPVPETLFFGRSEESPTHDFLLTRALSGRDGATLVEFEKPENLISLFAQALAELHAVNIEGCPFDQRLAVKVPRALENARKGLVRLGDLDSSRKGWSLERLVHELNQAIPSSEDLVFTHGDYCLPNVIFESGRLSGFIDLGRAGMADRHQDIALVLRSLQSNIGNFDEALFLNDYRMVKEFDRRKIAFYQLLDEFF